MHFYYRFFQIIFFFLINFPISLFAIENKNCSESIIRENIKWGHVNIFNGSSTQAKQHFETACNCNSGEGCHILAEIEANEGNMVKSNQLLKKACDAKEQSACTTLKERNKNPSSTSAKQPKKLK